MLKEKFNFFKKDEEGKNRQIENIIVFIIILIITVLIINNMWSKNTQGTKSNNETTSKVLAQTNSTEMSTDDLEKRLENILQSMSGVGKVKVLIKYSESSKIVAMYNETTSESSTQEDDGDRKYKKC